MMQKESPIWVRVAGHVQRIRANQPAHWRAYLHREGEEVPILAWSLSGYASTTNIVHGTDPLAQNALGLTAWIDFFGHISIEEGRLHITLCESPS